MEAKDLDQQKNRMWHNNSDKVREWIPKVATEWIHKKYCKGAWITHEMWQNILQQKKHFNRKPLEDL